MDIQPHKKNVDPPPDAKSRKIQRTRVSSNYKIL